MGRFFLGCLALSALALVIGHTVAANPPQPEWQFADNSAANNGGVMIVETYSASSMPMPDNNEEDMQPLPGNPGVEVAPNNDATESSQPIVTEEEDMLVQENE